MIRDRIIVCIASRWDYDPTSKHQVMKLLARHNDVVWVNYRGTRRPRVNSADIGAVVSTLSRVVKGVQRAGPRMVQLTPLVIPGATHRLSQSVSRRLLGAQIRRAIRKVRRQHDRPVQLWTYAPDVWFLADAVDCERLVYYCVDEYSEFQGFDARAMARAEQRLIERADVVITTSGALYESKRRLRPDAHLVRHGVDARHFARALDNGLAVPSDLVGLRRPMLGFFGLIHHWIDCDLIESVARRRPDYSFVLIGADHRNHAGLLRQPNVHLLGRRAYASLPAYCRAFDAALLPFVCNRMTENINPIKLREYLAAGLPVVSTPLPEAARYRPDVLIAADAESFARGCDEAVAESSTDLRRARSRRVADETWEATVERLSRIVRGSQPAPTVDTPAVVPAS